MQVYEAVFLQLSAVGEMVVVRCHIVILASSHGLRSYQRLRGIEIRPERQRATAPT